jgi:hypothetical protein
MELRRLGWQGRATLTGPARADILGHSGQRKDGKDGSSTKMCRNKITQVSCRDNKGKLKEKRRKKGGKREPGK